MRSVVRLIGPLRVCEDMNLETAAVREYLECRKASIGAASRLFSPTAEQFQMGEAAAAANPLRGAILDPNATRNCRF